MYIVRCLSLYKARTHVHARRDTYCRTFSECYWCDTHTKRISSFFHLSCTTLHMQSIESMIIWVRSICTITIMIQDTLLLGKERLQGTVDYTFSLRFFNLSCLLVAASKNRGQSIPNFVYWSCFLQEDIAAR